MSMVRIHPKQAIIPLMVVFVMTISILSYVTSTSFMTISSPLSHSTVSEPVISKAVNKKYPPEVMVWQSSIEAKAKKYNLDPDLVTAVIWQESGGDPHAYSRSGAVGLMQVMPRDGIAATFACPSGPCFSDRPSTADLWAPDFNIDYGCKLLSELIQKYTSVREGLKHYGPIDVGYQYADQVIALKNMLD